MRQRATLLFITMLAAIMCSCSGQLKEHKAPYEEILFESFDSIHADGYCLRGTDAQTLLMVTPNNDTLKYDITEAAHNQKVFGDIETGDELYVMLSSKDSATVTMVIDKSKLLGKWVQPDPIDGSDELGIELKMGGDALGINQSYLEYKSWNIINGKMMIIEIRDDGMDENDRFYTLVKLTSDSLILRADDDPEAPFEFGRWKENHEYDDLPDGLELDYGEADMVRF